MKNSFYVSFGVWISLVPFFGIPGSWKNALIVLSGIFLILVSLGPTILKKLQTKSAVKRKQPKVTKNETHVEEELRFSEPVETLKISDENEN